MMENPGPFACDVWVLDDFEFLPAGDALLSRRVKRRARGSPSSSALVEAVAATNDKVCWSSHKHCRTYNVNSKRSGVAIRRINPRNRKRQNAFIASVRRCPIHPQPAEIINCHNALLCSAAFAVLFSIIFGASRLP